VRRGKPHNNRGNKGFEKDGGRGEGRGDLRPHPGGTNQEYENRQSMLKPEKRGAQKYLKGKTATGTPELNTGEGTNEGTSTRQP